MRCLKKIIVACVTITLLATYTAFAQPYGKFNVNINDGSMPGYYFMCPVKVGANPQNLKPARLILDQMGEVIYYRINYAGAYVGDFTLQPNGLMSFSFRNKFFLMDSTFTVVDSVATLNGYLPDLHELQILPNGHYLILANEIVTMDLSSYMFFNNNGSPGSDTARVTCGLIQELDENKNLVFEWHSVDHFVFDDVDEGFLNDPINIDWTHFNAIELDTDGNLLVSSRHFNEITKIDRSSGNVIWRLGGKRNDFVFTNDSLQFKGQHDIRRLANGNITLFDNGQDGIGPALHTATAKEYQLDETLKTAELVWSYIDNPLYYSSALGNVQRLPDGNTLVNYGLQSGNSTVFNIVAANGQRVFELVSPSDVCTYRAFYYEELPWQMPRPIISCYDSAGQYYLDAGPGYASYLWSDSSANQVITINAADTFYVFVPLGMGAFIRSERFIITDIENPCSSSSVSVFEPESMSVFPNPVNFEITLKLQHSVEQVQLFNSQGDVLASWRNPGLELKIPCQSYPNGMYYLRCRDNDQMITVSKIIVIHQ